MHFSLHSLRRILGGAAAAVSLLSGFAFAANFSPGNIVVLRVGDGTAALTSAATPVFLDEYTPAGVLVQSIALPTAAAGTNLPLTNSGTATSEGFLNLSADGRFLLHAGYASAPGTASIASTPSATTPRVVARVAMDGTVDTSTGLLDSYSASNIRSATSSNGTDIWTGGTSSTTGGVRYTTLGATSATQLSTTITNSRVVSIYSNQLYTSSAVLNFEGVSAVGTGLPTATGQTITLLPGFPTTVGPSSYDYAFADANTVYVCDDRAVLSGGGLQRWSFNGTAWVLDYTLNSGLTTGLRGVTLVPGSSPATFYATSADSLTKLVTVTDTGATSAFTTLLTAGTNTALRGIRMLPVGNAATAYCFGDGSGAACPCGNTSAVGANEGCVSSLGVGGKLVGSGFASLVSDSIVLSGSGMPNSNALYFQGTTQIGAAFGDGVRCAGGTVIRLGTKLNSAGASQYPAPGDLSVSVRGNITAPGVRNYQAWYRNAAAFCTASTFNLTNGVSVTWTP